MAYLYYSLVNNILSAYFLALYLDQLSIQLTKAGVGCRIGDVIINNLCYTDHIVLLTTGIPALKILFRFCKQCAASQDLIFNPKKTVCQCFGSRECEFLRPLIKLSDKAHEWHSTVCYLGYDMNCRERDNEETLCKSRELYARANLISNRLRGCIVEFKKYFLRTYFSYVCKSCSEAF